MKNENSNEWTFAETNEIIYQVKIWINIDLFIDRKRKWDFWKRNEKAATSNAWENRRFNPQNFYIRIIQNIYLIKVKRNINSVQREQKTSLRLVSIKIH